MIKGDLDWVVELQRIACMEKSRLAQNMKHFVEVVAKLVHCVPMNFGV